MQYKINSEEEYRQIKGKIETYLETATHGGGFQSLNSTEQDELRHLSLLAEAWEDGIPIIPIRKPETTVES